jgi:hypothetical protein
MAWHIRTMALSGLVTVLASPSVPAAGQDHASAASSESPASVSNSTSSPDTERFEGLWVYNEEESVNAATGRQERSPRSATQRVPLGGRAGSSVTASRPATAPSAAAAGRAGIGPAVSGLSGQIGPTVAMIQENRSLARDLLEVPETLSISLAPEAVTFIDDLERMRVYATTGERSRYQLGAARFNAALEWSGPQLVKRIDGADGFRMTETYFLSEDGRRLFVIVRVGSDRKNAPVMGVNRVYDRIDP